MPERGEAQSARKFLVSGRVQAVGFRFATRTRARSLGLVGYARNLPDGRVEVVARGADAALDALADWLQRGPALARVTAVEEQRGIEFDGDGFATG